jgi:DNA modification methylase
VLKWTNNICTLYKSDSRTIPVPDKSIHTVVTSPPYWGLRDYGTDKQIGLEPTPEEYCASMVAVFREIRRVLRDDGTVWLNLGDSYSSGSRTTTPNDSFRGDTLVNTTRTPVVEGIKPKDLVGIPWRVAFALQADGWYLRSDIIWSKPNPMPESVQDRPTKAHEYIFLLSKNQKYYYDADAIRERAIEGTDLGLLRGTSFVDGQHISAHAPTILARKEAGIDSRSAGNGYRNKRSVWEISTHPYSEAHFATYPEKLVEPCILAGTSEKGVCAECGNPWERTFTRTDDRHWSERIKFKSKKQQALKATGFRNDGGSVFEATACHPTGWELTCNCNADTVPATVLDPFVGSGTTLAVAQRLGRKGVGTDINDEYLELAQKRLSKISMPMF